MSREIKTHAVYCADQFIVIPSDLIGDDDEQFPSKIVHTWTITCAPFTGAASLKLHRLMSADGILQSTPATFLVEAQMLILSVMVDGKYETAEDSEGKRNSTPITKDALSTYDMTIIQDLASKIRQGTATVVDLNALKNSHTNSG